jgi:hypothetical protein
LLNSKQLKSRNKWESNSFSTPVMQDWDTFGYDVYGVIPLKRVYFHHQSPNKFTKCLSDAISLKNNNYSLVHWLEKWYHVGRISRSIIQHSPHIWPCSMFSVHGAVNQWAIQWVFGLTFNPSLQTTTKQEEKIWQILPLL